MLVQSCYKDVFAGLLWVVSGGVMPLSPCSASAMCQDCKRAWKAQLSLENRRCFCHWLHFCLHFLSRSKMENILLALLWWQIITGSCHFVRWRQFKCAIRLFVQHVCLSETKRADTGGAAASMHRALTDFRYFWVEWEHHSMLPAPARVCACVSLLDPQNQCQGSISGLRTTCDLISTRLEGLCIPPGACFTLKSLFLFILLR